MATITVEIDWGKVYVAALKEKEDMTDVILKGKITCGIETGILTIRKSMSNAEITLLCKSMRFVYEEMGLTIDDIEYDLDDGVIMHLKDTAMKFSELNSICQDAGVSWELEDAEEN